MKKKIVIAIFAVTITAIVTAVTLTACASGSKAAKGAEPESEIVFIGNVGEDSDLKNYNVAVKDEDGNTVFPRGGEYYKIRVNKNKSNVVTVPIKNGKYTIVYLTDSAINYEKKYNIPREKNTLTFPVVLNNIRVRIDFSESSSFLKMITQEPMGRPSRKALDMDVVVKAAFETLDLVFQQNLKPNAVIAVFLASADTLDNSEVIYEQLQVNIVNSGRYTIVEKRLVDELLQEHDFQRSGLVSDATLVSFGKLLGADTVIISSVTGKDDNKRLVLIAVDMADRATLAIAKEEI
jgi:hypothetical protein